MNQLPQPRTVARHLRAGSAAGWAGSGLIVLGLALLAYAGLWQLGLAPGSRVAVPEPVALARAGGARTTSQPSHTPPATSPALPAPPAAVATPPAPSVVPAITEPTASAPASARQTTPAAATPPARPSTAASAALPTAPPPRPRPADADDRLASATGGPPPGYAVRLAIPSIALETEVKQAGIVPGPDGLPEWQTLPFVAAHYGDLTALVGAAGNAVIAGHVVTLREGNVFRNLYRVDLGDEVQVWDAGGVLRAYQVVEVKLVAPEETSVMDPTPDPRLTLITCGGTFDPISRTFSDRLIVVATPVSLQLPART